MEVPAVGKVKKKRTKVADFTFTAGQLKVRSGMTVRVAPREGDGNGNGGGGNSERFLYWGLPLVVLWIAPRVDQLVSSTGALHLLWLDSLWLYSPWPGFQNLCR